MTTNHAVFLAFLTCATSFSPFAKTGTIDFSGAIKQATCQINVQQKTINADCPKTTQATQFHIRPAAETHKLPLYQGAMNIKWLDASHKKGIITTTYR